MEGVLWGGMLWTLQASSTTSSNSPTPTSSNTPNSSSPTSPTLKMLWPGHGAEVEVGGVGYRVGVVRGDGGAWVEVEVCKDGATVATVGRQAATLVGEGRGVVVHLRVERAGEVMVDTLYYCCPHLPSLRTLSMVVVRSTSLLPSSSDIPSTLLNDLTSLPTSLAHPHHHTPRHPTPHIPQVPAHQPLHHFPHHPNHPLHHHQYHQDISRHGVIIDVEDE